MDAWLVQTARVVSADDVGRDELSVEQLTRKHDETVDDLTQFHGQIDQLGHQADQLPAEVRLILTYGPRSPKLFQAKKGPEIRDRLKGIDTRYEKVHELARLRKQRLLDALALYRLFNDADSVEAWIDEKAKLLNSLSPGDDLEEVEIMRHRFETLVQDMNNQAQKVANVNQLARQLLHVEHPNADEILQRQNKLNAR